MRIIAILFVLSLASRSACAQESSAAKFVAGEDQAEETPALKRTFHSADRKFSVQAVVTAYSAGVARLRKDDGTEIEVSLAKLHPHSQDMILDQFTDHAQLRDLAAEYASRFEEDALKPELLQAPGLVGKTLIYDVVNKMVNPHWYGRIPYPSRALTAAEVGTVVLVRRKPEKVAEFSTFSGLGNVRLGTYDAVIVHHHVAIIDVAGAKLIGRGGYSDARDKDKKEETVIVGGADSTQVVYVGTVDTQDLVARYLQSLMPVR
jgi:hypothetical protein